MIVFLDTNILGKIAHPKKTVLISDIFDNSLLPLTGKTLDYNYNDEFSPHELRISDKQQAMNYRLRTLV